MAATDNARRFDDKVEDYIAHRPTYPDEFFNIVAGQFPSLTQEGAVIADFGSGTGILSKQLLQHFPGAKVYGVEPGGPMRAAAESALAAEIESGRFTSVAATAEASTLAGHSCDLIVAGSAAHWFEPAATEREWKRVGKAGGALVLVWNMRASNDSGARGVVEMTRPPNEVMVETDAILDGLPNRVKERETRMRMREQLLSCFGAEGYRVAAVPFSRFLTLAQLQGLFGSISSTPAQGGADYERVMEALEGVFDRHQRDGKVEYMYESVAVLGELP